jgi:hypothetical protein
MRTTVRLDDALLRKAKEKAASQGTTLTALIDQGLRMVIATTNSRVKRKRIHLPVCRAGGGPFPGIDLDDTSTLLDVMEGRH